MPAAPSLHILAGASVCPASIPTGYQAAPSPEAGSIYPQRAQEGFVRPVGNYDFVVLWLRNLAVFFLTFPPNDCAGSFLCSEEGCQPHLSLLFLR